MPGKLSSSGDTTASSTMGVYKLSYNPNSDSFESTPKPKSSFMGRRFNTKVQPTLRSFLEAPELEHFDPSISISSSSEDDRSSVFTASCNTLSSDDDACLRELSLRGSLDSSASVLARHSTACCTDSALRQELRKKFHVEEDEAHRSSSFAIGHSFRRKLETAEDRVESLALWEETETTGTHQSSRDRVVRKDVSNPHSWHGESGGSGKALDSLFRKPKKATSSFFNGFFSGLSFSTSRRSRKL